MIKPVIDNNKLIGVVEEENIITLSTIGNLNDFTEPYQDGFYYVPATGYCEYVAVFNGEVYRGFIIESVFNSFLLDRGAIEVKHIYNISEEDHLWKFTDDKILSDAIASGDITYTICSGI